MNTRNPFLPLLLVIAGSLAMMFWLAPSAFLRPSDTLLGNREDGKKNYFTPAWHIREDSSATWFSGMNQPWGDHVVFADAQPAVSGAIRFISRHVTDLSGHTPVILHLLILISFVMSAVFLYLIQRHWGMPAPWAVMGALCIASLSPQLARLLGHFALAYMVCIPGLWWLLIRFLEKRTTATMIAVTAWCAFWPFVHPYYALLGMLFTGFTWIVLGFSPAQRGTWMKWMVQGFVVVLLPVIVFRLWLSVTDPVSDRPSAPGGYFLFRAWFSSVFLPLDLPYGSWVGKITDLSKTDWEGYAYVGICGTLMMLASLFILARNFIRSRFRSLIPEYIPPVLRITILASVLALLFSMRYPFIGFLRDWVYAIPNLSQFRSIGRFAWIFYYVWTVFTVWMLWRLYERGASSEKRWMTFVPLLMMTVWLGEGLTWMRVFRNEKNITRSDPEFTGALNGKWKPEWMKHVDVKEYEALIVLPFFHVGSEDFNLGMTAAAGPAFEASLASGLPLINCMMSRTSSAQTWDALQWVMEESAPLHLLQDHPFTKPLLLLSLKQVTHDRSYYLPAKGTQVYEDSTVTVYKITPGQLKGTGTHATEEALHTLAALDTLYAHPSGCLLSRPDPAFHFCDYEDSLAGIGMKGGGGMEREGWNYVYLYRNRTGASDNSSLVFSLWAFARQELRPHSELWLETFDGKQIVHGIYEMIGKIACREDDGWLLTEHAFTLGHAEDSLRVMLRRNEKFPRKVRYDEWMLREKQTQVFTFRESYLVWNNRWFPIKGQDRESLLRGKVIISLSSVQ